MDENVTRNLLRKAISLKTTIINKHNIKNFSVLHSPLFDFVKTKTILEPDTFYTIRLIQL